MKLKINKRTIFNIFVVLLSVGLIAYFCFSKDGLIDLLNSDYSLSVFWLAAAVFMQLINMFLDSFATMIFIRQKYKNFTFIDGIKVSFVGSFFSAITPSSTGGQPMQVYLMTKKNIDVGFSTSCMLQKFLVFQISSTVLSVVAIIYRFDYFINTIDNPVLWIFVIFGFISQVLVTGLFILVSFSKFLSSKLVVLCDKILHKIKFIKNPDEKVGFIKEQVKMFHDCNKQLYTKPKLLVSSYCVIIVQIFAILLIPYCVYRSFNLSVEGPINMICSQSFVNLAAAMMPLPGATGASELAFKTFYGVYYTPELMKSAILIWRIITYYGVIAICSPFSFLTKGKDKDDSNKGEDDLESHKKTYNNNIVNFSYESTGTDN